MIGWIIAGAVLYVLIVIGIGHFLAAGGTDRDVRDD